MNLFKLFFPKLYFGFADNVAITAGSGTTIAADEVSDGTLGSVKVQYVKLMDGTLDGTTKAAVGANGLKVDGSAVTQPVSAASLPLPSGASTAAKQPALGTAGSASTDVITIQGIASMTKILTTPDLPSGASTSAKQDTIIGHVDGIEGLLGTIDTDTGNISTKIDTVAGAIKAEDAAHSSGDTGIMALGVRNDAGTTLAGTDGDYMPLSLDANGALRVTGGGGGTEYTEDVASAADPVGTMLIARRKDTLSATEVSADGDNIALNSTNKGQLHVKLADTVTVDGSGVTQPVSGTVSITANSSVNVNQLAGTTTDTNSGNKSAGTLRVVLATDQPQLTNKLLVTPDANSAVNVAQMNGVTVSMDAGATGTGTQRVVQANGTGRTLLSAGGSASSSGNNTLIAAGTNKLKVYAFSLTTTSTTAMTCIFQSGAGGTELWRCIIQAPSGANAGANLSVSPPAWLFATGSATLLNLNLSSANAVHWSVSYFDEA